jgi:hypothetical protein
MQQLYLPCDPNFDVTIPKTMDRYYTIESLKAAEHLKKLGLLKLNTDYSTHVEQTVKEILRFCDFDTILEIVAIYPHYPVENFSYDVLVRYFESPKPLYLFNPNFNDKDIVNIFTITGNLQSLQLLMEKKILNIDHCQNILSWYSKVYALHNQEMIKYLIPLVVKEEPKNCRDFSYDTIQMIYEQGYHDWLRRLLYRVLYFDQFTSYEQESLVFLVRHYDLNQEEIDELYLKRKYKGLLFLLDNLKEGKRIVPSISNIPLDFLILKEFQDIVKHLQNEGFRLTTDDLDRNCYLLYLHLNVSSLKYQNICKLQYGPVKTSVKVVDYLMMAVPISLLKEIEEDFSYETYNRLRPRYSIYLRNILIELTEIPIRFVPWIYQFFKSGCHTFMMESIREKWPTEMEKEKDFISFADILETQRLAMENYCRLSPY